MAAHRQTARAVALAVPRNSDEQSTQLATLGLRRTIPKREAVNKNRRTETHPRNACAHAVGTHRMRKFWVAGYVAITMLTGACLLPHEKSPQRLFLEAQQKARQQLAEARRAMSQQDYGRAQINYWGVVGDMTGAHPAALLTQEEYLEARDGTCTTALALQQGDEAVRACALAVAEEGSGSAPQLAEARRYYRQQLGLRIDQALEQKDIVAARLALQTYTTMPDAKSEKIAHWKKTLQSAEKAAQRRQEQEAQAQAQAKQEAQRQREEQSRHARQRLARKWAGVKGARPEMFEAWILSHHTVLGAQFFSDVDIDQHTLSLWVADSDLLSVQANLSFFADIADAFSVWCDCEGKTIVGLDFTHLRGGKSPVYTYRLNPASGRSQLGR